MQTLADAGAVADDAEAYGARQLAVECALGDARRGTLHQRSNGTTRLEQRAEVHVRVDALIRSMRLQRSGHCRRSRHGCDRPCATATVGWNTQAPQQ